MAVSPQERRRRSVDDARRSQRKRALAVIHIAKKSLIDAGRLDEAAYRSIIAGLLVTYGLDQRRQQPSSADLNDAARGELIEVFRGLGWDEHGDTRQKGRTGVRYVGKGAKGEAGHLTQEQAAYIAHLEDLLGWTPDPNRLRGFIERQVGVKKGVEMLRNRQASDVITGLERLAGLKPHPRSKASD